MNYEVSKIEHFVLGVLKFTQYASTNKSNFVEKRVIWSL